MPKQTFLKQLSPIEITMPRHCQVHLLPTLFTPADVSGDLVIIVDILRASTTITHALANGATKVIPCGTTEEAEALRVSLSAEKILLGGERGGIKIDGFDLSNSPDDYSPDVVSTKTIGFTTTNGTNALLRSRAAGRILIGCFANISKTVERIQDESRAVHIVCAGTNGKITGEDVLFAGAIVNRLHNSGSGTDFAFCDSATLAQHHWKQSVGSGHDNDIEVAMRNAQGGKNLIALGYDKDIATAAAVDSVPVVAEYRDNAIYG